MMVVVGRHIQMDMVVVKLMEVTGIRGPHTVTGTVAPQHTEVVGRNIIILVGTVEPVLMAVLDPTNHMTVDTAVVAIMVMVGAGILIVITVVQALILLTIDCL